MGDLDTRYWEKPPACKKRPKSQLRCVSDVPSACARLNMRDQVLEAVGKGATGERKLPPTDIGGAYAPSITDVVLRRDGVDAHMTATLKSTNSEPPKSLVVDLAQRLVVTDRVSGRSESGR